MVSGASVLVTILSFSHLVFSQSGLASLPGFLQWQKHLAQHAVSEGREPLPITQTQTPSGHSNSWTADIARVKEAEERLRQRVREQAPVFTQKNGPVITSQNINVFSNQNTQALNTQNKPVLTKQSIQASGGVQVLEPEVEREETEDFESVLREKIRKIIEINLENLRDEENEISEEIFLEEESEEDNEVFNPLFKPEPGQTFLDRLSELLSKDDDDENQSSFHFEGQEILRNFADFENEKEDEPFETDRRTLSDILTRVDLLDDGNDLDFLLENGSERENYLFDVVEDAEYNSLEDKNDDLDEDNYEKQFMDEELEETKSEAELIADELALILVRLQADQKEETDLMLETYRIIRSRLKHKSTKRLLEDEEFINSVFYRFAIMRLPLRPEDIPVSELAEIKNVVRSSLASVMEDTKELLRELRRDIIEEDEVNKEERAKRIDIAKRKLQKLLEIISSQQ